MTAIEEERQSIIERGNGQVHRFALAVRSTKKANGMDHFLVFRALGEKKIGPCQRAVGLAVVRGVVRDDDNGWRGHQSLDVVEDFGRTAISERGIQDGDIRFAVQYHRGGFFRVRRFSHDVHASDFLKALPEFVAKVGICVGEDDGHQMAFPGVTVFRVVHSLYYRSKKYTIR